MAFYSKVLFTVIGATLAVSSAKAQSWTDKITLGGDFRYRLQRDVNTNVVTGTSLTTTDNLRQRIRARLMAAGKVNDDLTAKFRLSTGSARTSNNDLGDSAEIADKKAFNLDLGYFEYKVGANWMLELGKAPNPYWRAGGNFMSWHADQTFEGVQTKYTFDMDTLKPFLSVGYHVARETGAVTTPNPDIALLGAQLGVNWKMDPITVGFALNSYSYNNIKGTTPGAGTLTNFGNSLDAGGAYAFDYKLMGAGLEVGYSLGFAPLAIYTDYLQNSDPSNENKAMIAGLRLGALKDIGSWTVGYNYRDVRKDALFGQTTETSFLGGGSDVMGHQVQLGYQAWANTAIGVTWDAGQKNISSPASRNYEDLLIDLVASF